MNNIKALTDKEKHLLLTRASDSIRFYLDKHTTLSVDVASFPERLQIHQASFVTLTINKKLRGCIGTLEAYQPLIKDVNEHAKAAAFNDPRFPELTQKEFEQTDIHISVLTPKIPVNFSSEADLLAQLKPDEDGLVIERDHQKATFLPSVWSSLPEPESFLSQLKLKAGMTGEPLKAWRYHTQGFGYQDT